MPLAETSQIQSGGPRKEARPSPYPPRANLEDGGIDRMGEGGSTPVRSAA